MIEYYDDCNRLAFPLKYYDEIANTKNIRRKQQLFYRFTGLMNKPPDDKFFIVVNSIGYKWVVFRLLKTYDKITYYVEFVKKLPYSAIRLDNKIMIILNQYKNIKLSVVDFNYCFDEVYKEKIIPAHFYAMVKLEKIKMYKLIELKKCCCVCLEDNKQTNENNYFECVHNDLCHQCFMNLNVKICPICRSKET